MSQVTVVVMARLYFLGFLFQNGIIARQHRKGANQQGHDETQSFHLSKISRLCAVLNQNDLSPWDNRHRTKFGKSPIPKPTFPREAWTFSEPLPCRGLIGFW
jgi:hypothetical protein